MSIFKIGDFGLKKQYIFMILIIIIPAFLILGLSGYRHYRNVLQTVENDTGQMISGFVDEQLHITNHAEQFLKLLSEVPVIRKLDRAEGNKFLQDIHKYYPQYSTIVAADATGKIEVCAIPLENPINVQDRSWFKRVSESGKFVIDDFLISRTARRASLPFAYPVLDDDGKMIAALGAAFDLSYYKTIFDTHILPDNSKIIVTDRNNIILYNSESETQNGSQLIETTGFNIPEDEEGSFSANDKRGSEYLYWFKRLYVGHKSNEISILIGISKTNVFYETRRTLLMSIISLLIVTIISVAFSWIFTQRFIIHPIQYLLYKTQQVNKGKLDIIPGQKIFISELKTLDSAFDLMTESLLKRDKERTQNEAALKDGEERLKILFNRAADAIYVSDENGNIIQANRKASYDSGYSEQELLSMKVWDIDAEKNTRESFKHLVNSFDTESSAKIESFHKKKNGDLYPVEITIAQLHTRDGIKILGIARDITERRNWENYIERTLKDRETLLKELYHRTKNNMEVIRAMLYLNAAKYTTPEVEELVLSTRNRILAMSMVHQMLYQTDNLSKINLKEYITGLSEQIIQSFSSKTVNISLNLEIEDIDALIDISIPIGLVINELITNSMKHAFLNQDYGTINISMNRVMDKLHIHYSDNGIGLPDTVKKDKGGGFGTKVINSIIEKQLYGKISYENNNGMLCDIEITTDLFYDSLNRVNL